MRCASNDLALGGPLFDGLAPQSRHAFRLERCRACPTLATQGALPMTAVSGAGPVVGSPESPSSRDVFSLPADVKATIRILIVDDERTLRESCASVLRGEGYSVTLAGRGEEAL